MRATPFLLVLAAIVSEAGCGAEVILGTGATGNDGGQTLVADPYSGPFNVLVLSLTTEFHHDSIPAIHQMLRELGPCVDAASCAMTGDEVIAGAKANSSFTVKIAGAGPECANDPTEAIPGCDGNAPCLPGTILNSTCMQDPAKITAILSEFSEANLRNYQMIFFANPTGPDFSMTGPAGLAGMAAVQKFIEAGGAFVGVHSAGDFEQSNGFPFYTNVMLGSTFSTLRNDDGTQGDVVLQPGFENHPVVRGLPVLWSTTDEWYVFKRDVDTLPGFEVLAKLNSVTLSASTDPPANGRPVVWIKEFPPTDPAQMLTGRVVYTMRGHNIVRYQEPLMRKLVHQAILWAAHRLD
jgi:type 1 glutamine amidotransferase